MSQLFFFFNYAARNIRRGGQWSLLAIFSIAAGVATVVALRSLGLAIGDSLVSNVRIDNKGDVRLIRGGVGAAFSASFGEDVPAFSVQELQRIRNYVEERNGEIAAYAAGGVQQIASVDAVTVGRPQFISTFYIDPETYPPSHTVTAIEPDGIPISQLFGDGNEIVISDNMAQAQNLGIGDTVRVGGTEEVFTVVGIVDAANEAGIRDIFSAFFGFVYIDIEDAQRTIADTIRPNNIVVAFDEPLSLQDSMRAEAEILSLVDTSQRTRSDTTAALLERNETIARVLGDFIVVLGLGALLIGGVGIMNTMLVMVRRRTVDIASLKTFGLKGRQVGMLFLAEALLLGLAGSIVGSIIGVLLGGIVNSYGETFLQQQLVWRVYPEALVYGFVLGMLTTVIFGIVPIVTALQVRPGIILRPNETHIPRLSIFQTIGLMLLITIAIGLIVGQIIQPSFLLADERSSASFLTANTPYIVGIIGVAGTLMFLGFLVMVLWVIVWLVGKFPTFGSVDLRLALRNLSTNRTRTATTLLALSAGMFALSSITFVGQGVRELLNLQLVNQFGGNVLAFPLIPGDLGRSVATFAVNNALADVEGVRYRSTFGALDANLIAIDGRQVDIDANRERFRDGPNFDQESLAPFAWNGVLVWDTDNPDLYGTINPTITAGRNLTLEDRGQRVLVGPADFAPPMGISVGSILTYEVDGRTYDFEVVGLARGQGGGFFNTGGVTIPPESIPAAPIFQIYSFLIEEDAVNEALVSLSTIRVPPTFSLDVSFIDSLLSRLIDQFTAIPTVVGLLSLAAAAVIMANTVALSTLERRRQIGILKSIGLKGRRVLVVMLIETTVIGLLSAVLGIGLSSVTVSLFTGFSGTPIPLPADARLTAVALFVAAVLIGWVATFLSANVALRERVMNVLRYE